MYKAIKHQLSHSRFKKKKSVFSANFLFFIVVSHCGFGLGIFFFAFLCFYIKLLLDLDIHALIEFFFECNNKATVKKIIEILHMCKGI